MSELKHSESRLSDLYMHCLSRRVKLFTVIRDAIVMLPIPAVPMAAVGSHYNRSNPSDCWGLELIVRKKVDTDSWLDVL